MNYSQVSQEKINSSFDNIKTFYFKKQLFYQVTCYCLHNVSRTPTRIHDIYVYKREIFTSFIPCPPDFILFVTEVVMHNVVIAIFI